MDEGPGARADPESPVAGPEPSFRIDLGIIGLGILSGSTRLDRLSRGRASLSPRTPYAPGR
jgi:hypothetical protein